MNLFPGMVLFCRKKKIDTVIMRHLKKILVLIVGGTVLLIGIVLIFLPGPSFIVIPAGLAILAIEFSWARKLLKRAQNTSTTKIFSFFSRRSKIQNEENHPRT